MKKVAAPAAIAIVALAFAVGGVWLALVHGVAGVMSAQGRLAGELLDANVPTGETLARTLLRPGLHIVIFDYQAGTVTDAGSAGTIARPMPLGSFPGGGAPAGSEVPGGGGVPGVPPAGGPFPPPGAPAAAQAGPSGTQAGPIAMFALHLAQLPPLVVERGGRTIQIEPDGRQLGLWFALDALTFVAGLIAIVTIAGARAAAQQRGERRALEARLSERREAAERYQRFLAEAGHELRTPLTVMAGYVDILRARGAHAPLDERIVEGMHAETSRMRALVEKMMILARLDSLVSVPRLLDVASAAREAAQTIQRRYPEREVRVETGQGGSIVIDADDYAAALGNVLENAVKYAPGSPIAIETNVRDGRATTSVVDWGPGIVTEDRPAIFERFYRGRGRDFGEGLGLGLAIVKRVADRWDGTVDFESGEGRTVFRLSFPLADEEVYGVAR